MTNCLRTMNWLGMKNGFLPLSTPARRETRHFLRGSYYLEGERDNVTNRFFRGAAVHHRDKPFDAFSWGKKRLKAIVVTLTVRYIVFNLTSYEPLCW